MKKIMIISTILNVAFMAMLWGVYSHPASTPQANHVVDVNKKVQTFDDLLDAIEWVESKGDSRAVGDGGDAVGAYQIHKIYVRDCNRIIGLGVKEEPFWYGNPVIDTYTYKDRLSQSKSREMASIFLLHYGGTFEEMARKHNGGPNGHNKEATKPYWEKVKERMSQ